MNVVIVLSILLFIFEIYAFTKRKKALIKLYKSANQLDLTQQQAEKIENICNAVKKISFAFALILFTPFVKLPKKSQLNLIEQKNGFKFDDFSHNVGVVLFYTSPILYFIYIAELMIKIGIDKLFQHGTRDKFVMELQTARNL